MFAHTAIRPDAASRSRPSRKIYPNSTTSTRRMTLGHDLQAAGLADRRADHRVAAVCAVGWRSGCSRSRVLLTRIVSDTPLPEGEGNEEMLDAVLQNSLREYDLYDPATNTIEKVFDERTTPRTTTKANRIWATAATSCILGSPARTVRPHSAGRTRWSAMTAPRAPGRRNAAPTPRAGSTAASGRFPLTGSSSWWCCGGGRTP